MNQIGGALVIATDKITISWQKMPFTLAHPISILPLKWLNKDWFSTTGLIVGSMAPDYEYFVHRQPSPTLGETLWGAALFNLPLAVIVALVFHLLIKRPLIQHLPAPLDRWYSPYARINFLSYLGRHWAIFLSSLIIGIASHLLLDQLTSPYLGPFADTSLAKDLQLATIKTKPLLLAERSFDALGTLALFWILFKNRKPYEAYSSLQTSRKGLYWGLLGAIILIVVLQEWYRTGGFEGFGKSITIFIWAMAIGMVLVSAIMGRQKRT